jgi:L-fucose isomerase-like protein
MKMLCAAAKMRRTRCVVIRGNKRHDAPLADTGIMLRYVPASTFIEEYRKTPDSDDIVNMADEYMRRARRRIDATRQDVINGLKSYYVAGRILERQGGDAITMDCLGALGKLDVSLPCIAWSRMNDDGIPAACEADTGAAASLVMTHYLFDRPGFQQDPVADTADDTIIGAHCSCATRLNGYDEPPEPFDIKHHHGNRDAVPRTIWREGQRVTSIDLLPGSATEPSTVLVSAGTVVENKEVPPSGGCVVSVKVKFDGDQEVLSFPGFHQIFFYGDYEHQVRDFCQLCGFKAQVV